MHKTIPLATIPVSSKELLAISVKLVAGEGIAGKDVSRFESDLTTYLGVDKTFSFNTGRTALYVALQALNLNPGEEVIVPAYTCAIVFEVILRLGLRPVFVDVDVETCNINPELIQKAVTPKTKVIVPVHLFGRPCDMDPILEISEKLGLYLVEDVAQALGARFKNQKVGTFGDLAMFSFGPGKSITGGEGGALAVNNSELGERIGRICAQLPRPGWRWVLHVVRNVTAMKVFSHPSMYALIKNYVEESVGESDRMILHNCLSMQKDTPTLCPTVKLAKMPNLSAAIIREQLLKADRFNEKRIANANKLTALLGEIDGKEVSVSKRDPDVKSTYTRYVVRVIKGNRELIMNKLLRQGIGVARPYYYIGMLLEKLSSEKYQHAENLANSLMALPNHPLLTESDVQDIYDIFIQ